MLCAGNMGDQRVLMLSTGVGWGKSTSLDGVHAQPPWGWKGASNGDGWGRSAEGTEEGASNGHDGAWATAGLALPVTGRLRRVMSFLARICIGVMGVMVAPSPRPSPPRGRGKGRAVRSIFVGIMTVIEGCGLSMSSEAQTATSWGFVAATE